MPYLPPDIEEAIKDGDLRPSTRALRTTLRTIQEFCLSKGRTLWIGLQRSNDNMSDIYRVLFRHEDNVLLYEFEDPTDTNQEPEYRCSRGKVSERDIAKVNTSLARAIQEHGEEIVGEPFEALLVANARWLIGELLH